LYLDNAATSFPKPREVADAMSRYFADLGASPGRGGYAESVEAGRLMSECRAVISRLLNAANPNHIIFTLNCSDALNLAIKGLIDPRRTDQHAVCTSLDHNSILRPLNALADDGCLTVTRVPVDPTTGLVDPQAVRRAMRPETKMIAVTHASNVTGTVQPLRAIGAVAKEAGVPFVVDAAQSAGHVPIDAAADHIDLLAAPGHKFLMGPLGTGFLWVRPGLEKTLRTLKEGGTGSVSELDRQPQFMPDKFESGSHNAPGVIGLLAGARWVEAQTVQKLASHDARLTSVFLSRLEQIDGLTLYGPPTTASRIGVFSVRVGDLAPQELSAILESGYGVLTRSGLHCAPHAHGTLGTVEGGGTTRLSFGPFVTEADVMRVADALAEIGSDVLAR
jgi:cysteine desulfurase family protein